MEEKNNLPKEYQMKKANKVTDLAQTTTEDMILAETTPAIVAPEAAPAKKAVKALRISYSPREVDGGFEAINFHKDKAISETVFSTREEALFACHAQAAADAQAILDELNAWLAANGPEEAAKNR